MFDPISAAILGTMAVAGIGLAASGGSDAKAAGKEAAKTTGAEQNLLDLADAMVTGVDRADVERQISQATTPIAGSIAAGQQNIAQDVLATEGGGGAPSRYAGRAAALRAQLAQGGANSLAQAATQAQQIGEQKGLIREEQRASIMAQNSQLARQRKQAALQGSLVAAQGQQQLGSSLAGGAASGVGMAAGNQIFA